MNIHFIGIAGSAMGSTATACRQIGHTVTGSDQSVYEPMSSVLSKSAIVWYEGFDADKLRDLAPDLVVIGNAISRGNAELEYVLDHRLAYTSMAGLVGSMFIDRNTSIVVAGTHGKTTTSSMTAWILESAGRKPGFLIGGVPQGFSSGCRAVPRDIHNTYAGVFVSEGDEYDTAFFDKRSKFVHYRPTIAVVNNIEFDHADIFHDVSDILRSFDQMIRIVPMNGLLLVNSDDAFAMEAAQRSPVRVERVGLATDAEWCISDLVFHPDGTDWNVLYKQSLYGRFSLSMSGLHNVRNATMSIAASSHVGVHVIEQVAAIASFSAPKRRLENIGVFEGCIVVDDFAHHPTAIAATVAAIAQKYPDAAIHAVFEPRSNTTTRAFFQNELVSCFKGAASVCIGPVNRPERYKPEDRLNTDKLVADLALTGVVATSVPAERASDPQWGADVVEWLRRVIHKPEERVSGSHGVVLILSNGNVGGLRLMIANDSAADHKLS